MRPLALIVFMTLVQLSWHSACAEEVAPSQRGAAQTEATPFTMAYTSIKAVCWPDVPACGTAEHIFCDIETFGIPEIINGRQVLVSKSRTTQQCMLRKELSRFENSMHDSVIYKRGIRP